jgi:hypothetical protein
MHERRMLETMSDMTLGRLEKVELREAWASEAIDFTPWLAREDNLKLLGETIGIELELESQEKEVGPFRADILCRDTVNGDWVLIENQLEPIIRTSATLKSKGTQNSSATLWQTTLTVGQRQALLQGVTLGGV